MKLYPHSSNTKTLDGVAAVQHCANRTANNCEGGALEKAQARANAVEGMLGRLIDELISNHALRAVQVSTIFDYDVIAEDD